MSDSLTLDSPPQISTRTTESAAAHTVLLVGNPNVGKTTLFNALTGQNAQVGNYPGITVERRSARLELPNADAISLVDVPGAYSLSARSAEEQVALQATLGLNGNPTPTLAIVAINAAQLGRNLYLAAQLIEFQVPVLLVLTMMDEVSGSLPKPSAIGAIFGVPCVAANGRSGDGIEQLRSAISDAINTRSLGDARIEYAPAIQRLVDRAAESLPTEWRKDVERDRALASWALLSLDENDELTAPQQLRERCCQLRAEATANRVDLDLDLIKSRYAFIEKSLKGVYSTEEQAQTEWTERLDRVLLHPVWGLLLFIGIMLLVFQSLFSWADPFISLVEAGVTGLQELCLSSLEPSIATDFLVQGVLGGVGNVVVFLPQILLLFFFVGMMEDSGYMARVAYLMDRILRSVGLHGRAFVPMLSGLACAVPAILATRTMERRRDRLLTMLVVPLMSCSARLPIYTLIIGALFPPMETFGPLPIQGLLMIGMYLFSTAMTLIVAAVLGRTVVKGKHVPLLLELPRYRLPKLSVTLRMMWLRARQFLREAGTVILGFTMILWILLSFPKVDEAQQTIPTEGVSAVSTAQTSGPTIAAASQVEQSYAGQLGKALEPAMQPLGFDWKLTVGILGAFSAREVFVSTLGLVFGIDDAESDIQPLRQRIVAERRSDGNRAYPPLVGASLMVFFALACQCVSTLAVVKRETASWKWPALLFTYMTTLAYLSSLAVYQFGKLLGFAG